MMILYLMPIAIRNTGKTLPEKLCIYRICQISSEYFYTPAFLCGSRFCTHPYAEKLAS